MKDEKTLLGLQITKSQKAKLQKLADAEMRPLSNYVRTIVLKTIESENW